MFCVTLGCFMGGALFFHCQDYDRAVFIPYVMYMRWCEKMTFVEQMASLFYFAPECSWLQRQRWSPSGWPITHLHFQSVWWFRSPWGKKKTKHRDLGSPFGPLKIQGPGPGDLWYSRERLFAFVDCECHDEVLSFLSSCLITTFREPSYN